jgi:hypothetical protein
MGKTLFTILVIRRFIEPGYGFTRGQENVF